MDDAARSHTDATDGPVQGRDETPDERSDRNWVEALQELRVLQTGTQIITGFLLALAFQPAFADLTQPERVFYLVLVVLAALSAIFALAPVALHRFVFRRHVKELVVAYGHAGLFASLVTVSVLLVGVVSFIFLIVVDTPAAWIAGTALAVILVALWLVVPITVRVRGGRRPAPHAAGDLRRRRASERGMS